MHLIRWSLLIFPAYYPHSLIVAQANYPSASLGPQNYHLFPDPLHPDFSLPFLLSLNSMINNYTHSLMKWSKVKSLSSVRLFVTPWTGAYQAPPSMGCSRQEYWSRLPFPSPGGSSQLRNRTLVSSIAGRRFNLWATREALSSLLPWLSLLGKSSTADSMAVPVYLKAAREKTHPSTPLPQAHTHTHAACACLHFKRITPNFKRAPSCCLAVIYF